MLSLPITTRIESAPCLKQDLLSQHSNQVGTLDCSMWSSTHHYPSAALHIALSANHCIAAAMKSDGSVKLKLMEYTHGSLNSSEDDRKWLALCF